ncbi:MAG: hypothetical protein WAN87_10595 [Thermoplasmata archaeon]
MTAPFYNAIPPETSPYSIRTVAIPWPLAPPLFRALLDVRSAVNNLVGDWRAHLSESRFTSIK